MTEYIITFRVRGKSSPITMRQFGYNSIDAQKRLPYDVIAIINCEVA